MLPLSKSLGSHGTNSPNLPLTPAGTSQCGPQFKTFIKKFQNKSVINQATFTNSDTSADPSTTWSPHVHSTALSKFFSNISTTATRGSPPVMPDSAQGSSVDINQNTKFYDLPPLEETNLDLTNTLPEFDNTLEEMTYKSEQGKRVMANPIRAQRIMHELRDEFKNSANVASPLIDLTVDEDSDGASSEVKPEASGTLSVSQNLERSPSFVRVDRAKDDQVKEKIHLKPVYNRLKFFRDTLPTEITKKIEVKHPMEQNLRLFSPPTRLISSETNFSNDNQNKAFEVVDDCDAKVLKTEQKKKDEPQILEKLLTVEEPPAIEPVEEKRRTFDMEKPSVSKSPASLTLVTQTSKLSLPATKIKTRPDSPTALKSPEYLKLVPKSPHIPKTPKRFLSPVRNADEDLQPSPTTPATVKKANKTPARVKTPLIRRIVPGTVEKKKSTIPSTVEKKKESSVKKIDFKPKHLLTPKPVKNPASVAKKPTTSTTAKISFTSRIPIPITKRVVSKLEQNGFGIPKKGLAGGNTNINAQRNLNFGHKDSSKQLQGKETKILKANVKPEVKLAGKTDVKESKNLLPSRIPRYIPLYKLEMARAKKLTEE